MARIVPEFAVVIVLEHERIGVLAQSSNSSRRVIDICTPSGNWCDGVT